MCSIQTIATPAAVHLADRRDELVGLGIGQAGADLVEQQHHRAGRERPRQLEPLAVEQAEALGRAGWRARSRPQSSSTSMQRVVGVLAAQAAAGRRARRSTFSNTVMSPNGRGTWWARPIPSRQRLLDARTA